MRKKPEGWNVVLAGFWNRMIFTPEWVAPRLFEQDTQIETVVALLPVLPIIYRDQEAAVEISNARIVCRARDLNNEAGLRRTAAIAQAILDALPETPIQGLGLNFAFREPDPAGDLLELFNFDDSPRLAEDGWEVGERKVIRRLTRDEEVLNLSLTLAADYLDLEFNFHTDPDDRDVLAAALDSDRLIRLRDLAIQVSQDLYGLVLENDGE